RTVDTHDVEPTRHEPHVQPFHCLVDHEALRPLDPPPAHARPPVRRRNRVLHRTAEIVSRYIVTANAIHRDTPTAGGTVIDVAGYFGTPLARKLGIGDASTGLVPGR